jgi:hypothetical protein
MSTQTTDVAAWLDELEEAHKAWMCDRGSAAFAVGGVPKLTAALRAVLALAEEFIANGNSRELGDPSATAWFKAADRLRAVVATAHPEEGR